MVRATVVSDVAKRYWQIWNPFARLAGEASEPAGAQKGLQICRYLFDPSLTTTSLLPNKERLPADSSAYRDFEKREEFEAFILVTS